MPTLVSAAILALAPGATIEAILRLPLVHWGFMAPHMAAEAAAKSVFKRPPPTRPALKKAMRTLELKDENPLVGKIEQEGEARDSPMQIENTSGVCCYPEGLARQLYKFYIGGIEHQRARGSHFVGPDPLRQDPGAQRRESSDGEVVLRRGSA